MLSEEKGERYLIGKMTSLSTERFYIWFGSGALSLVFQVFGLEKKKKEYNCYISLTI